MSQALRAWWRDRLKRPLLRNGQEHAVFAAIGVVAIVGIFFAVHPASAGSLWEQVANALLILFGKILQLIVDFLGNLVIILVDILIGIAQYNNFVHAQPVNIGWPLVRDVVNMLFIVILLVSAFSTIIGYKELHYTKVLAKLLLMAVLINFSKTLLGLMIDFSQVLMLTFVNAFKQAAGGNFVTALHLDQVLQLRKEADEKLPSLIGALLLAVLLMGITLSLILIMIAFLAARIIGLWLLLIMSPMAFFALALPPKLSKGFSAFTNDFWSRLSTLLIAGPVMAFFLWLALAVAQGGREGFTVGDQTEADTAQSNFASAVGNPVDLMTFIVAVALMLQGVEFGMKTAQSISPALGGFLSTYASPKALAKFTGVRAAARGAYRYGAKPLAKTADFATGGRLSKTVGRAGLAVSGKLGGIGAETFAGLATRRKRLVREKEGKLSTLTADLDPATQLSFLRSRASGFNVNPFEKNGARIALAKASASKPGLKYIAEEQKNELKKKFPGMSEDEIGVMAEGRAQLEAVRAMKVGSDTAKSVNDTKTIDWLDERRKSSGLAPDWETLGAEMETGRSQDVKKYLATKSASAYKDSASAIAILAGAGAINVDGSMNKGSDAYKMIMEKGGDRAAMVEQHERAMTNEQRRAHIAAMRTGASDDQRKAADAARMFVGPDKDGRALSVNLTTGAVIGSPGYVSKGTQAVAGGRRNEAAIARGMDQLKELRRQNIAANSPKAVSVKMEMAGAGAKLSEAFRFDSAGGVFDNEANRTAFAATVGGFVKQAAAGQKIGIDQLANLDVESMSANPKGYNEARSAAIDTLTLADLKKAFDEAMKSDNKETQGKIKEILQMVSREATRVEDVQKAANVSSTEMQALAAAPDSEGVKDVLRRLSDAGIGTKAQAVELAKTVALHNQIEFDEQAQAIRGKVKDRAFAVARATGRGLETTGSTIGGAAVTGAGAVAAGAKEGYRRLLKETREQKTQRKQEKFERKSVEEAERIAREEARRRGNTPPPPDETV